MGFSNDGDNGSDLVNDQIRKNEVEIAQRTKSLSEQRLSIIKSQGMSWQPGSINPNPAAPAKKTNPFLPHIGK